MARFVSAMDHITSHGVAKRSCDLYAVNMESCSATVRDGLASGHEIKLSRWGSTLHLTSKWSVPTWITPVCPEFLTVVIKWNIVKPCQPNRLTGLSCNPSLIRTCRHDLRLFTDETRFFSRLQCLFYHRKVINQRSGLQSCNLSMGRSGNIASQQRTAAVLQD